MTPRQLRYVIKLTLLPPKYKKASLRSASRADIAIRHISNLLHHSRAWSAAEAPPTPTICASPSRARWDARSATSSRCLCAEPITGTIIALETSKVGGVAGRSTPSGRHDGSGFPRGVLNERDRTGDSCKMGPTLPQPVFDPKIINSDEFALVVRYYREVQRQCVSGYEQVVCANWLAGSLQGSPYPAVYGIDGRFES